MEAEEKQRARERAAIEVGAQRYALAQEGRHLGQRAAGATILDDIGLAVARGMWDRQQQVDITRESWEHWLLALKPGELAALVLHTALSHPRLHLGVPCVSLAFSVVEALRQEIEYRCWLNTPEGRNMRDLLRRTQAAATKSLPRRTREAVKRAEKITLANQRTRAKLGAELVRIFVVNSGGWFDTTRAPGSSRSAWLLVLSEIGKEAIVQLEQDAAMRRPANSPMVAPPVAWIWRSE